MKRYRIFAGALAAALMWTGAQAADFGQAPSRYQTDALDYIASRMVDDRGARFRFEGQPYRVMVNMGTTGEMAAWAVDVQVRSRLERGRTGAARYTVVFVKGTPVALESDIGGVHRV